MVGSSTSSSLVWWLATPSRGQPWSHGPETRVTLEVHHAIPYVAIVGGSSAWWRAGETNGDEENRPGRGHMGCRVKCKPVHACGARGVPAVAGGGRIYMSYRGMRCRCSTRDGPSPTHGRLIVLSLLLGSITVSLLSGRGVCISSWTVHLYW
jgi:hypothetical protein